MSKIKWLTKREALIAADAAEVYPPGNRAWFVRNGREKIP